MDVSFRQLGSGYSALLRRPAFRALLGSKLATRIATDALLYAMLIHIVQDTGSARHTSILVLAYTIPAVLFGLLGGAVAEALPLRPLLLTGHAGRVLLAGALAVFASNVSVIYPLIAALATIGQIVGPAEASAIPRVVPAEERPIAHSLVALTAMVGTVVGAVTLGPILFKIAGWQTVLLVSGIVYAIAGGLAIGVAAPPTLRTTPAARPNHGDLLFHGLRAITARPDAFLALGYLTIAVALGQVLVAVSPYYAREVLEIRPENTVFIVVPAAAGAVAALPITPVLARAIGMRRTVELGFYVASIGLCAAGALAFLGEFVLTHADLRIDFLEEQVGRSSLVVITMAMTFVVGFGGTMLGVVAATTINQEVASDSQARAAATVSVMSAVVSLVPLFAVAAAADVVGVRTLLSGVAISALLAAAAVRVRFSAMKANAQEMLPSFLGR